jgi:hypothetical protein
MVVRHLSGEEDRRDRAADDRFRRAMRAIERVLGEGADPDAGDPLVAARPAVMRVALPAPPAQRPPSPAPRPPAEAAPSKAAVAEAEAPPPAPAERPALRTPEFAPPPRSPAPQPLEEVTEGVRSGVLVALDELRQEKDRELHEIREEFRAFTTSMTAAIRELGVVLEQSNRQLQHRVERLAARRAGEVRRAER